MGSEGRWSYFQSMLVPLGIALAFLLWGLAIFYLVGEKPFQKWDFGIIRDVPAQSPYSTERIDRRPLPEPERIDEGILRQHVDSNPNEKPLPTKGGTPNEKQ